jgi:hypothetical protein
MKQNPGANFTFLLVMTTFKGSSCDIDKYLELAPYPRLMVLLQPFLPFLSAHDPTCWARHRKKRLSRISNLSQENGSI